MTVPWWAWVIVAGSVGGGLSALMARQTRMLPSVKRLVPGTTRVIQLGVLGNVLVAAAGASAAVWMIGIPFSASGGVRALLAAAASFWIGFLTARWATTERDLRVLRQAVCRAASAPAAHPDTVRAIANAPPDAVYDAVNTLIPRHVRH